MSNASGSRPAPGRWGGVGGFGKTGFDFFTWIARLAFRNEDSDRELFFFPCSILRDILFFFFNLPRAGIALAGRRELALPALVLALSKFVTLILRMLTFLVGRAPTCFARCPTSAFDRGFPNTAPERTRELRMIKIGKAREARSFCITTTPPLSSSLAWKNSSTGSKVTCEPFIMLIGPNSGNVST